MDSIAEICATLDVPSFAIAAAKHLCWEGNTDLPCAKNTQDSVRRIEELLKVVVRSVEQQAIVVRNLWAAALPNADKPPDLQVGVIGNMSVDDQSVLVLHLANELKRTLQFVTNGESIIVTPGDTLERITTACLATPDDPILPCAMAALAAKLKAAVLRLRQARPRGISVDRKKSQGSTVCDTRIRLPRESLSAFDAKTQLRQHSGRNSLRSPLRSSIEQQDELRVGSQIEPCRPESLFARKVVVMCRLARCCVPSND